MAIIYNLKIPCKECGWIVQSGQTLILNEDDSLDCPKCGCNLGFYPRGEKKMESTELLSTVGNDALATEKLTVYLDVINLFTSFTDPKIQKQIAKNPQKQEALARQMNKIGIRLALIGSDSVVKGYVEFRELSQTGEADPEVIVRNFGAIMLGMRNDLDLRSTQCTVDDMLGSFIVGKV